MKYLLAIICLLSILSCQTSTKEEKPVTLTETEVAEQEPLDIEVLKAYFSTETLTDEPINIHHWVWSEEGNETFKGATIASTLLKKYVNADFFQFREEEEYFAIAHFEPIDAYLIRTRIDDVDYMQQLFLLMYDAEKQEFVSWTRVAAFLGAEGFINKMASWITDKELIQRNYNWSLNPDTGETETDSIRTHFLENHTFKVQETKVINNNLDKKYPLI